MRFVVDVQLPMALVRDMRRRGHEADRVVDLIARTSPDTLVLTLASARGAVIMTKDEDFIDLSARMSPPVPVVRFCCGNISNANLLKLVDQTYAAMVAAIERGEVLIELR